ncbi:hypothetical protein I4U23_005226 [Adineta vaga]|nr:hypothetical protein I4U23_005226 [Adineta vaga]
MDNIEQFLQNFPNLTHLEIKDEYELSDRNIIDGYRWQRIVQSLISFHFLFYVNDVLTEQSLDSFRTSFWIEEKRWFIAFYDKCLFTISISDHGLSHMKLFSGKPLYSTLPNNTILYRPKYSMFGRRICLENTFRFTSIKNLYLDWNDSFKILSSIIDLKQIEMLKLSWRYYYLLKDIQYHMPNLRILKFQDVIHSIKFLEKEHIESAELKQIRTLKFETYLFWNESIDYIDKLSHSFPLIEHLSTWPIRSRSDIIYCIDKFPRLTSVSFHIHDSMNNASRCSEFVSDLILNDIKQFFHCSATCYIDCWGEATTVPEHIHIWLGKRKFSTYQRPRFEHLWYKIKNTFQLSNKPRNMSAFVTMIANTHVRPVLNKLPYL